MARKAYSDQEREHVKEALMSAAIQCIVDRGLIHSSIDVLCRKVGISKTFFYTFFRPSGISSPSCCAMPGSSWMLPDSAGGNA